jgi:hypothetical protein
VAKAYIAETDRTAEGLVHHNVIFQEVTALHEDFYEAEAVESTIHSNVWAVLHAALSKMKLKERR